MTLRKQTGSAFLISWPILLFIYFIVFMLAVEFVMLFWIQSSLNTAAQQVARIAASDVSIPLNANGIRQRCQRAIQRANILPPGYSADLKASAQAYQISQIQYNDAFSSSDPQENTMQTLYANGLLQPSDPFDQGNGPQYSGCFALINSKTSQINFYVVLHKSNAWPLFIKAIFVRGKWVDGRGSYPAQALESSTNLFVNPSGFSNNQALNRSISSVGVRPFLRCASDVTGCNDAALLSSNGVCNVGNNTIVPSQRRPKPNVLKVGEGIWTTERRQSGVNNQRTRIGIDQVSNCGNIDPLILLGLRYDCRIDISASTGFNANNVTPTAGRYLCGDFIEFRNLSNGYQVNLNTATAFDQTSLLNPTNDPIIIRRGQGGTNPVNNRIDFLCKTFLPAVDSLVGNFDQCTPARSGQQIGYTVVFKMRSQLWTNTPYTAFNPMFLEHTCRHYVDRFCP